MITLLESQDNKVITTLKIVGGFRTYEDYSFEDKLRFSVKMKEDKFINDAKKWIEDLDDLESVNSLAVDKIEVDSAEFEDDSDYESGKLIITLQLSSDSDISDSDLDYIAECCCDDLYDYLEGHVEGTIEYTEEYYDPYASDYRGERDVTAEIDEYCSISSIFNDISWERI